MLLLRQLAEILHLEIAHPLLLHLEFLFGVLHSLMQEPGCIRGLFLPALQVLLDEQRGERTGNLLRNVRILRGKRDPECVRIPLRSAGRDRFDVNIAQHQGHDLLRRLSRLSFG